MSFLQLFLRAYPEYEANSGRNVYLSGWSYAGKFIPLFSKYINEWLNDKTDVGPKINY